VSLHELAAARGRWYVEAKGDLSTSSGGMSIDPAPESRDPYLAVVAVHQDIEDPVEVIATIGLEERRTVVVHYHRYAALTDELI
jgi:hypothetical protein